jgi:hypothetical protein
VSGSSKEPLKLSLFDRRKLESEKLLGPPDESGTVSDREQVSAFRGVSWHKATGKWRARISAVGKQHHLGYYTKERVAARAYDRAAANHHGDKAKLNFSRTPVKKECCGRMCKFCPFDWVNVPKEAGKSIDT